MDTGTRILLRTTTRNARRLWSGTALIGLHQVCEALVPILIGVIIDRAVAPGDAGQLALWVGVLAGLFILLTTAYRNGARLLMKAIAEEAHVLRLEVTEKILHPRGLRTDLRAGDLLTISTSDTDNTSYLLDYVPRITGAVVATAASAVALLIISVPLGLVVLIATPVVLVALQLCAPLITRRVADQQELAGAASSLATDLVTGLRPLRGIGAQQAAADRYRAVSQRSLRAMIRAARTQGGYLAASTIASTLLAGGIAILAGWFALEGRISVGQFITVIGLAQFLIEPFGLLAIIPSWVAEARASAGRVALIADAAHVLPSGQEQPPAAPGELRLENVHFGTLRGLDLHVRPGEFVGVVPGRCADSLVELLSTRSGESTLVEPHHADLFTGTIRSNVLIDTDEDPAGALRATAADEVVALHADGLEQVVAERGASLSGGQRQRLALARALLARPSLLVLHDPTTAVDAVTEHAIAQGIRAFRAGLTTLVITNSPALLAATDRVVVLGDGVVTAEGEHAALGATHEDYRKAVLR